MQNFHYMQKEVDGEPVGEIKEIPLNEWQNYRTQGFEFRTQAEYRAQQAGEAPAPADDDEGGNGYPTMANTKDEILAYAENNNIEVNPSDTKSDILWGIAQVLEIDPAELGVE